MVASEWDDVSYVISSRYRIATLKRLSDSPATPSRIAEDTDLSVAHVSRALQELRDHELTEAAGVGGPEEGPRLRYHRPRRGRLGDDRSGEHDIDRHAGTTVRRLPVRPSERGRLARCPSRAHREPILSIDSLADSSIDSSIDSLVDSSTESPTIRPWTDGVGSFHHPSSSANRFVPATSSRTEAASPLVEQQFVRPDDVVQDVARGVLGSGGESRVPLFEPLHHAQVALAVAHDQGEGVLDAEYVERGFDARRLVEFETDNFGGVGLVVRDVDPFEDPGEVFGRVVGVHVGERVPRPQDLRNLGIRL